MCCPCVTVDFDVLFFRRFLQILGYINPWLTLKGPGATCTVAREVLDVFMGLLLMSNRISQANRLVRLFVRGL